MTVSVSHVGICVTDLERSLRFYCDGLGFQTGTRFDVGAEFAATLEVEGGDVEVTSQFVSRDGLTIELLHYRAGKHHGEPSRSRGQVGFTHLSVVVDDVDEVAARLVEHGGSIVESTRTRIEPADGVVNEFLFVADPDGVRVELMKLAG